MLSTLILSSILIIGDSHTARDFGQNLEMELSKKAAVTVYAAEGSKPSSWLIGENIWGFAFKLPNQKWDFSKNKDHKFAIPKANEIITTTSSANTVVVAFGSNGMDGAYQLAKLIKDKGKNCIWITPPPMLNWMRDQPNLIQERNTEILQAVGKLCKVIVSSQLEVFQTPIQKSEMNDEIHFNQNAPKAHQWAKEVVAKILTPNKTTN